MDGLERKDWENLSPDEEATLDAIEESILSQIRSLQEEDATHDKIQIADPKRMMELEATLKKIKMVLNQAALNASISMTVGELSKAGCISIRLPDNFFLSDVTAFCDALGAADRAEIGIASGQTYLDLTFYGLIQTTYLN